MHPNLLFDVIKRQAGSTEKALLEGVMNAIDAGASKLEITVEQGRIQLTDDGSGFQGRESILAFFETFGTPHEEAEHKRYGEFRMGRGQLFAIGKNTWRSNTFAMVVDIKTRGLDYELQDGLPFQKGCAIEIEPYEKLTVLDVRNITDRIEEITKFAEIPIKLNGKIKNKAAKDCKWSAEDEVAYYRFNQNTSNVQVFNLGVFVCDMQAHNLGGVGGVVVSKQQMKVNFARNDIIQSCPVWKQIRAKMLAQSDRDLKTKKAPNDEERRNLIRRIATGDLAISDYRSAKVFKTTQGKKLSYDQLKRMKWGQKKLSFAPLADSRADFLQQRGLAVVLDEQVLEWLNCSGEEFQDLLNENQREHWNRLELEYVPLEQLAKNIRQDHHLIDKKDITIREQCIMTGLASALKSLGYGKYRDPGDHPDYSPATKERRRLMLGKSDTARGWTDGDAYIAINRNELACEITQAKWVDLVTLLAHELCHDGPDMATHQHGIEFYEAYHDLTRQYAGTALQEAQRVYQKALETAGRRVTRKELERQVRRDKVKELEQVVATACTK